VGLTPALLYTVESREAKTEILDNKAAPAGWKNGLKDFAES
jgi:hypothetical protein